MSTPVSRYLIARSDLKVATKALQIGTGMAALFASDEALGVIVEAEDWADQEISDRVFVPLKAAPAPGQEDFNPADATTWTKRNYPYPFTQAIVYYAAGLMIHAQFAENSPNSSTYGDWCLAFAFNWMERFKQSLTKRVGASRMRHPNSFMPPQIALPDKPETQQASGGFGGG